MTAFQEFLSIWIAGGIAMFIVLLDWEVKSVQPNVWFVLASSIFWPWTLIFHIGAVVFSIRRW